MSRQGREEALAGNKKCISHLLYNYDCGSVH
ncbi:hypothetical protein VSF3289_01389 [Vibrio scophthalmi]|uniref:Uncharacterized protein n=1 Tax=Vibrio scophthalmi TaxID=45658 RepID=A0A1E3WMX8_9VIBR|nr:hypothetical protein VSF3289_01389 [Vibrio scophthalmi]